MIYINHRINSIEELIEVPLDHGIELDLRDRNNKIIMQHDPFKNGQEFELMLSKYQNKGPIILNIKSEGIEVQTQLLLKKYKIDNYFFLDCSFPMIRKLVSLGESKIAVRFSEYEPLESVMALAGMVNWVWVDCFTKLPLDSHSYRNLKNNFKICIVSPELQGHPINFISEFAKTLVRFPCDAICTKNPTLWKHFLNLTPISLEHLC
jgi:hypothetical protein